MRCPEHTIRCRLRAGKYLASPDSVAAVCYETHARYSVGGIEHIIVVSWREEPLLCHVIGIAGEVVLKDILGAGVHTGDSCHDGRAPNIEEAVVTERVRCCHVLGMLPAEPVNIGVSGQSRATVGCP